MVLKERRPECGNNFIDDILFMWAGDESSAVSYLNYLNDNSRGIQLSYEIGSKKIHFLDLKISIVDDTIITSTFFKNTDRNGYIPMDSCHHPSWLSAEPKGQFLRLRRNCTHKEDYFKESMVLRSIWLKGMMKGYSIASFRNWVIVIEIHSSLMAPIQIGKRGTLVWHFP